MKCKPWWQDSINHKTKIVDDGPRTPLKNKKFENQKSENNHTAMVQQSPIGAEEKF